MWLPSGKLTVGPWKWPIYSGFTSLPTPFSGRVHVNLLHLSSCIIFFVGASKQWEYTAMLGSCANSWIANNIDPENSWESSVARGREYSNPHNWQSLRWSDGGYFYIYDHFLRVMLVLTPLSDSKNWGHQQFTYWCLVGNEGMIHWLTINNHPSNPHSQPFPAKHQ